MGIAFQLRDSLISFLGSFSSTLFLTTEEIASTWQVYHYLLEFGSSSSIAVFLLNIRHLSVKHLQGHPSSLAIPPTHAWTTCTHCLDPSLLSLCHYVVVSSSVYSVINHHLEGSAGSKQKKGYSCRWFSLISQSNKGLLLRLCLHFFWRLQWLFSFPEFNWIVKCGPDSNLTLM